MQKYPVCRLLLPALLAVLFISCSKMDATYKDYVVPNGITYVGRADSINVYPGRSRIKLTWLRGTDPKTTQAVVYWNNKADSLVFPVPQKNPKDTVSVMLTNMQENTYTFNIYTMDADKNRSIRVDVQGTVYNTVYESVILSRPIGSVAIAGDDVTLNWLAGDTASFSTEINYVDIAGVAKRTYIAANETSILLEDVREGSSVTFRSLYKPSPLSLDTFYTAYTSRPLNMAIAKPVKQSSSTATTLVDGNLTTFWQPLAADRTDDKKVWVTVDLKAPKAFNQVKHYWTVGNTLIQSYKVLASNDEAIWETLYEKTSAPALTEDANFNTVTRRYVRLEFTIKTDGNLNVTEFEVYNKQ
ncbi:DUF4998 domain-containing protein [Chitinophaga niabensis]|uniref:F5/8 type C domain-containing protein n=1 Tax=Chitinophaga niabensis TaxID=536979 RepID=A0A1N6J746_9BACT|nr:DUF4998 domain-containing protein [Chitinophaga niabensis]SIO39979.1 F5/8 type C domain-containing protein [Chitinophaga niabensis]